MPDVGIEPTTTRLKVLRSTDWANQANRPRAYHNKIFLLYPFKYLSRSSPSINTITSYLFSRSSQILSNCRAPHVSIKLTCDMPLFFAYTSRAHLSITLQSGSLDISDSRVLTRLRYSPWLPQSIFLMHFSHIIAIGFTSY